MDADLIQLLSLVGIDPSILTSQSELLLVGLFFLATAALMAFCVPGVLVPMALGSGALLGAWEAAAAVALGAAVGSQIFFLGARRFAGDKLRGKLGQRLEPFQQRFARHGIWYLVGLRLIGAPHVIVASASAVMSIRASTFALATLLGVLPAIAIGAATGSAI